MERDNVRKSAISPEHYATICSTASPSHTVLCHLCLQEILLVTTKSNHNPPGNIIFNGDKKKFVVPVIHASEKKKRKMPTIMAKLYGPPT